MMSPTTEEVGGAAAAIVDSATTGATNKESVLDRNGDIDYEEEEEEEKEEESTGTRTGCCYRCCVSIGCHCCARFPETWPRTFAILMGIVVPLFTLIAISVLFGYGLASLEAPSEVDTNDAIVATRAGVALSADFFTDLTQRLPHACLNVYFAQNNLGDETVIKNETLGFNISTTDQGKKQYLEYLERLELEEALDLVFVKQYVSKVIDVDVEEVAIPFDDVEVVNTTDLMQYMTECGQRALEFTSQYDISDIVDSSLVGEGLSFNWVRCDGDNTTGFGGFFDEFRSPYRNKTRLMPDVQEQIVLEQWKEHQQELYNKYFSQFYNEEGMRRIDAKWQALQLSFEEATGHEGCDKAWYAGAWFWFTIMTTIGYGNTAPTTDGARAMVFTLGFLSILLFGAVLAKAGSIVTAIADDAADRLKLTKINVPWVGTLVWGALYYAWMCAIASYTVWWKDDRLAKDMPYKDAYWFAFISTTTVGFGDFFLEHEVTLRRDLIVWPLLFLFGFVLLSSFLNKLSELLYSWFPQDRPTLEENLENTDVPFFPKLDKKFILSKKKQRKKELESAMRKSSMVPEIYNDEVEEEEENVEDFVNDEEYVNESTPVEANGLDGSPWKGAVTQSHKSMHEEQAPQDAA